MLIHFRTYAKILETVRSLIVHGLAKSWDEQDLPELVEKAAIGAGVDRMYEKESAAVGETMELVYGKRAISGHEREATADTQVGKTMSLKIEVVMMFLNRDRYQRHKIGRSVP